MFLTRVFPYYQRKIINKKMKNDILDILAELHHKGRNHQMGRDFYDWIPDGDGKVSESNSRLAAIILLESCLIRYLY